MNNECLNIKSMIINKPWQPPTILDLSKITKGDMPGDQIKIGADHIAKAQVIFPELLKQTIGLMNNRPKQKVIVSVHGGSGVGKSEIGALLSYYFTEIGLGSYVLSGDNYPKRIPYFNDAERLRVFRVGALKGLASQGLYNEEKKEILEKLMGADQDSDTSMIDQYPWLKFYQEAGCKALSNYLGSSDEIDFEWINDILDQFKNRKTPILLKRMGREASALWCEAVDFSGTEVLIIEWTHGNNKNLEGVDFPILLNSTPEETLAHRRLRNRDGALDSPFTTMVLSIEQAMLHEQAKNAKMIISKKGEIIPHNL